MIMQNSQEGYLIQYKICHLGLQTLSFSIKSSAHMYGIINQSASNNENCKFEKLVYLIKTHMKNPHTFNSFSFLFLLWS